MSPATTCAGPLSARMPRYTFLVPWPQATIRPGSLGVDPDGRLIVLWAPSSGGEWQVFDATAAMGYRVRGPDLVWSDPFWGTTW